MLDIAVIHTANGIVSESDIPYFGDTVCLQPLLLSHRDCTIPNCLVSVDPLGPVIGRPRVNSLAGNYRAHHLVG